jgi:hypothetical protein
VSLIDLLRFNTPPKYALFLDGTNQNAGFNRSLRNEESYSPEHPLFQQTQNILKIFKAIKNNKINLTKINILLFGHRGINRFLKSSHENLSGHDHLRFCFEEAESYIKTKLLISEICKTYNITPIFILQPNVWHSNNSTVKTKQGEFIDRVYNYIKSLDEEVIDLRDNSKLNFESNFFIDWAHMTAKGNFTLAKVITERLNINC